MWVIKCLSYRFYSATFRISSHGACYVHELYLHCIMSLLYVSLCLCSLCFMHFLGVSNTYPGVPGPIYPGLPPLLASVLCSYVLCDVGYGCRWVTFQVHGQDQPPNQTLLTATLTSGTGETLTRMTHNSMRPEPCFNADGCVLTIGINKDGQHGSTSSLCTKTRPVLVMLFGPSVCAVATRKGSHGSNFSSIPRWGVAMNPVVPLCFCSM